MIHGWRSQIHYWSRQTWLLKRLAAGIVIFSFLAAWLIIALTPERREASVDPLEQRLRQEWQSLHRAEQPQPYELVRWLHRTTNEIQHLCQVLEIKVTTWEDYQSRGRLADYDVKSLLAQHASTEAEVALWETFIRAELRRDTTAVQALADAATQEPPLRTAHYIRGRQLLDRDPPLALKEFVQEATLFPEDMPRTTAFHWAINLHDETVLRQIANQPDWWDAMPASLREKAAIELSDVWLQVNALAEYKLLVGAPWNALSLTLLSASVWYVILVLHGGSGRWRWLWPLLPVVAGVLSIWPVLLIIPWQDVKLGMREDAPFPFDLWYQIGGVGVREELSKLLLASLFMPWLLRRRAPGAAILLGAFVGLGFALEENIEYYLRGNSSTVLGRFFTANFYHAALTGISTHALYQLCRSRFGTAEKFLLTLAGVVTAHGVYNYGDAFLGDQSVGYLSIIVLAFVAWHFLDLIDQECTPSRQWVQPGAVLLLGTAVQMAAIFLWVAIQTPDRQALTGAAASCVSLFPIAFIYWRRLGA